MSWMTVENTIRRGGGKLICERCGASRIVSLPTRLTAWLRFVREFEIAHSKCEPRPNVDEGDE